MPKLVELSHRLASGFLDSWLLEDTSAMQSMFDDERGGWEYYVGLVLMGICGVIVFLPVSLAVLMIRWLLRTFRWLMTV